MSLAADPGAIFVSALLATGGLWWFQYMLKDMRKLPRVTRYGVYLAVWLAYFIVVMVLVAQAAPGP